MLCRLVDLKDRLEELTAQGAFYRNGYSYTENDIRYALPEHLGDISKVECAIELVKEDLLNKYAILVYETEKADRTEESNAEFPSEDCYEQIVLVDILLPAILSRNKIVA